MIPFFEAYRDIIPDFSSFQESLRQRLPVHIRANSLKIEPEAVLALLAEKGIYLERTSQIDETLFLAPGLSSAGNLPEYFLGYIHPQALTSCLASIALSVKKSSLVLDMCASPGGKTSHAAQLMANTGLVVANELYPSRQKPLAYTLDRLGVLNTILTGYQAQEFPMRMRFDYVLADVPCSGEGTLRFDREGVDYREKKLDQRLIETQEKIIIRGFDLLKSKGEMLYSTCTYNPEENEEVVDYLLKRREADILPISCGADYEPGLLEWKKKKYDKRLRRTARFYPHRINSVGFYMARIGRRS
ncbi:MAG: RsmB/NOP family class I SAM-dependent RNA methyltransferase [Deltaproteobacteria bacterium]|nr:RsmB/NOP family class I SAM-dependent RNA methyltransferase [Deltaproteobacteria bacterium]MBW1933964.1 RsmB/NOP family class I SAM-dependent RNA methyltransferase [Deltaproteobacteria bacterium]MBW1976616.1 RsmB/NOP family class I SAM-dependent RNA methyltransferase [Deltaproteobacteria bacterium]MBW2043288.1 RsmB/NOP family class I SAM-dependent RNA methyltransferase [Deltaproteobacteria bacterium]MBW2299963.1 RsmB/NOP family class I SAM-dependent RNA methyltransferase [Deltaproteobacteria